LSRAGGSGERALKEKLLRILEERADPRDVSEWLWEEFGKRVQPSWQRLRRAILKDKDITPQDLVSLLDELNIEVSDSEIDDPDDGYSEACSAARELLKVSSPERGGNPGFTVYHVIEALKMARDRSLGRPALQRSLGLGEASAKTLLNRLKAEGLAVHAGRGVKASERGVRAVESLGSVLGYASLRAEIPGLWDEDAAIVYVACMRPPDSLLDVYRVRDYLVEEGCRSSVIGGGEAGGPYRFPGVPEDIERVIDTTLEGTGAEGLVVVVPVSCLPQAVSALVRMLAEECPCKPPG
jgi:hypothetical protein